MAEIWSFTVNHSAMVGVSVVFQCLEMIVLAAVKKCQNILLQSFGHRARDNREQSKLRVAGDDHCV